MSFQNLILELLSSMEIGTDSSCSGNLRKSLRNRAEALSLKTQLLARVFVPDPRSGSSQVSDVICQIDLACARFMRMAGTLGAGMASGLPMRCCSLSVQQVSIEKVLPLDYSTIVLPLIVGVCLVPVSRNEQVAVLPLQSPILSALGNLNAQALTWKVMSSCG